MECFHNTHFLQILRKLSKENIVKQCEINNYYIQFFLLSSRFTERASVIFNTVITDQAHFVSNFIIKKAQLNSGYRQAGLIKNMYKNEAHFYQKICPELKAFEQKYNILESLIPVPDYITSSRREGSEIVVLSNLSCEGFEMKRGLLSAPLDEHHVRSVFKTYGRFHAISFCLKYEYPVKFRRLASHLDVILKTDLFMDQFKEILHNAVKTTLKMLNPQRQHYLIKYLNPYLTDPTKIHSIIFNLTRYKGEYGCFLHGDCSVNNIMFKYNVMNKTREVQSVKLLDFGHSRFGSPVHDLAEFFYISTKEACSHFENLGSYLENYYESFSNTVRKFNQNPEKVLPKVKLLEDWNIYSKFYMFLALNMLTDKYTIEGKMSEKCFTTQNCALLDHMHHLNVF